MSVHEFARVPNITAGAGAHRNLGGIALALAGPAANVLLVADPGLKATGLVDQVKAVVEKAGLGVTLFTDLKSDPTVEQADAATARAKNSGAALVLSLGGGSALDLGKSVAAIAAGSRSAVDYELCKAPFPARALPKICVPTTSGTGSETTRTAILTRADHAKVWLWGDELKSTQVVLDPELTVTLPRGMTAATGIDALVHAVEAATNANANALGNLFAFEAIRLVAHYLPRAIDIPDDIEARAAVQRAAAYAGVAIDNCGTAIAHALGHAMGSLRPIHHGRAVGIALLASLPWNMRGFENRFAACAAAMGATPTAPGFLDAYERLLRETGMTIDLAEEFAGVTPEMLAAQTARPENDAMRGSNQRPTSHDDLLALSKAVLLAA